MNIKTFVLGAICIVVYVACAIAHPFLEAHPTAQLVCMSVGFASYLASIATLVIPTRSE